MSHNHEIASEPAIAVSVPDELGRPRHADEAHPRILVVEDEALPRRVIAEILRQSGHEVSTIGDGQQALNRLLTEPFDLLITDIRMPGLGGLELLETLRHAGIRIPVVLVTGYANVDMAALAVEFGAARFLMKPFEATTLKACVRGALAHEPYLALDSELDRRSELERVDAAISTARLSLSPLLRADLNSFGYHASLQSCEPTLLKPRALLDAVARVDRSRAFGRKLRSLAALQLERMPLEQHMLLQVHIPALKDPALYEEADPLRPHAQRVVLELTDTEPLRGKQIVDDVDQLRSLGYRLAVSGLGTGHGDLSNFVSLKPEFATIGTELTRKIEDSPVRQRLVRALVKTCRSSKVEVIASGVESSEQHSCLARLGCALLMGYHLG